jgi:hypothetical protein
MMEVEKDRADGRAQVLRDDICELSENLMMAKGDLEVAHKIGFEKDRGLEEKKVMIKQLYNELKQEKKESKRLRLALEDRAQEVEGLRVSEEIRLEAGGRGSVAGDDRGVGLESAPDEISVHS